MKTALPLTLSSLLLLMFTSPATPQRFDDGGFRNRIPNLNGVWFMNGNEDLPCRIVQRRPDGRAEFINEHGQRARGEVYRDRVFIPDWNDGEGSDGLEGRIRGDLIIWPNGSYWSHY
jgi:hypothetical protein